MGAIRLWGWLRQILRYALRAGVLALMVELKQSQRLHWGED